MTQSQSLGSGAANSVRSCKKAPAGAFLLHLQ